MSWAMEAPVDGAIKLKINRGLGSKKVTVSAQQIIFDLGFHDGPVVTKFADVIEVFLKEPSFSLEGCLRFVTNENRLKTPHDQQYDAIHWRKNERDLIEALVNFATPFCVGVEQPMPIKEEYREFDFVAEGLNAYVGLKGRRIVIRRSGAANLVTVGLVGDKTINIDSISGIQLKKPGDLTVGYIQFGTTSGELSGGMIRAMGDENTVRFGSDQFERFEELKASIEALQDAKFATPISSTIGPSLADQISDLAKLLEKGLLSEEEFKSAKGRLLNG